MLSSITARNSISSNGDPQTSKIVSVVLFLLLVSVPLNLSTNLPAGYGQTMNSSETVTSKAVEALGGPNAIQQIKNISILAEGERYEPGQKFSPEEYPKHVSNFNYNLTQDLVNNKMRIEWQRVATYPYVQHLEYTVVMNNNTGFTYGKDGYFSPSKAPMLPTAVSAWQKEQFITSPFLLMGFALMHPESVTIQADETYNGRSYHTLQLAIRENTEPIRILLDQVTFLPAKVVTLEDDPIHGDAQVQVLFHDWRNINGVYFPFSITHFLHDEVIEEKRGYVNTNTNLSLGSFLIPENVTSSSDPDEYLLGWQSSQWFLRMHAFGIPHYNRNLPVNFTEIAPSVYHVTGSTHNSLVIEMDDYIIVVEAPLYEERTKAIIDEIKNRWPDKAVRYVISTHAHDDHIGGLRAYGAEGAVIITSNISRGIVDEILSAPHTIRPDELQLNKRNVDVVPVSENKSIGNGNRSIEILSVKNSHSKDMLAVYLPKEKILLNSDLYSPETAPPPFKVYSKQLLDFIDESGINVETIAGTHGKFGPLSDLQKLVHGNLNDRENQKQQ
jgi:glyoxylase-like metal-dependent hydrolase (beta-lactamase superfamily II)